MSINNIEIQDNNGNIYYPHTDASVVKFGDSDVGSALSDIVNDISEMNTNKPNLTTTPQKTVADITYYVDVTNGNDSNNGTTSGTAFKTIQHAIDILPKNINHTVTINVASGTYSERVLIYGFLGSGTLNLLGGTIINTVYNVGSMVLSCCPLPITVRGFNLTDASNDDAILIGSCLNIIIDTCNIIASATSKYGIRFINSMGRVANSVISNKNFAIFSSNQSIVFSTTNSGTSNTVGLYCNNAAKIGKFSTQPAGTTAETIAGGGTIG